MTTSKINQICPVPSTTKAILVRISPVASTEALDRLALQLNDIVSHFEDIPVYPVVGDVFFEPLTPKNIDSVLPSIAQRQYDIYAWQYNPDGIGIRGGANDYLTTVYGATDAAQVIHKLADDHTVVQIVERDGLHKRRAPVTIIGFEQAKLYIDSLLQRNDGEPQQVKTNSNDQPHEGAD